MANNFKNNNSGEILIKIFLIFLLVLFAAGAVLLYFGKLRLLCPVYTTTGIFCPGCGSGRALYALLHLKILKAVSYNAVFVFSIPFLAYLLFVIYAQVFFNKLNSAVVPGKRFAFAYCIVMAVFTILRNLPGSFLAP